MFKIYRVLFALCFLSVLQASAYSESDLPIQEPKVPACSPKITVAGCPAVAKKLYEWFEPSFTGSLYACLRKAAQKAGYKGPINKFYLSHKGIHVIKKSNSPQRGKVWSLHSFARAIDISAVTVNRGTSKAKTYSYPQFCSNQKNSKNVNTRFFHRLRQCWSRTLGSSIYGIGPYWGSITCEDPNHRGHMHLSLPYSVPSALWNKIAIE